LDVTRLRDGTGELRSCATRDNFRAVSPAISDRARRRASRRCFAPAARGRARGGRGGGGSPGSRSRGGKRRAAAAEIQHRVRRRRVTMRRMSPPTCFGDAGGHAFGRSGGGRYRRCLFRFIVASSRSLALSSLGLFLFVSLLLVAGKYVRCLCRARASRVSECDRRDEISLARASLDAARRLSHHQGGRRVHLARRRAYLARVAVRVAHRDLMRFGENVVVVVRFRSKSHVARFSGQRERCVFSRDDDAALRKPYCCTFVSTFAPSPCGTSSSTA
jgi:hypothetical protein